MRRRGFVLGGFRVYVHREGGEPERERESFLTEKDEHNNASHTAHCFRRARF